MKRTFDPDNFLVKNSPPDNMEYELNPRIIEQISSSMIINPNSQLNNLYISQPSNNPDRYHFVIKNSKLYQCNSTGGCNQVIANSENLQINENINMDTNLTISPLDKLTCPSCNKIFKSKSDLTKHIRTHTGEKPFICNYLDCKKSFSTSHILKIHMRMHTGEKPYVCDYCGNTFTNSTHLKNHTRSHTGEKPYICKFDNCFKRFSEYSSLYKHQLVHKNKQPDMPSDQPVQFYNSYQPPINYGFLNIAPAPIFPINQYNQSLLEPNYSFIDMHSPFSPSDIFNSENSKDLDERFNFDEE